MFAICCAVALRAEVKDRILLLNMDYRGSKETNLVFIDDLSKTYNTPSKVGHNSDSTSSPFASKTSYECKALLQKLCTETNAANIDCDHFAVADQQFLEDDTLLVVVEPKDNETQRPIRVTSKVIESRLQSHATRQNPSKIQKTPKPTKEGEPGPEETGYKLHEPNPADFFPPELRREMLLDNGERILLGTRDLEKDYVGEVVWLGGRRGGPKTAKIVRELFGDEKSPPFRPKNSGSTQTGTTVNKGISGDD